MARMFGLVAVADDAARLWATLVGGAVGIVLKDHRGVLRRRIDHRVGTTVACAAHSSRRFFDAPRAAGFLAEVWINPSKTLARADSSNGHSPLPTRTP
jgi:hypothetical protein